MPSRTRKKADSKASERVSGGYLRQVMLFPLRILWGGIRMGVRGLAPWGKTLAVTGGVVAASWLAWLGMVRALENAPGYRIPLSSFAFGELPEWLEPGMAAVARQRVLEAVPEASMLDPDVTGRVADVLGELPWVREVVSVRKVHADRGRDLPPRLAIRFMVRRPVARVAGSGREMLVDADGVLLPGDAYRIDRSRLPVLLGVLGAPPRAGQAWPAPSVHAALRLLDETAARRLEERYAGFKVSGVDLSGFGNDAGDPDLVLLTPERIQLRFSWGVAPGRLTIAEQLDRLEEHLAMEKEILGRLRQPYAPLIIPEEYVELRFSRPSCR